MLIGARALCAVWQAVLAQSGSAVAQFQALLALKEGVLRDWGTTAPAQVDALRTQVRGKCCRARLTCARASGLPLH